MNVTHDAELCSFNDLSESQTSDIVDLFNDFESNFSLRSFRNQFYDDPLASDLASLNISVVRDVECATPLAMILVGYLRQITDTRENTCVLRNAQHNSRL